MQVATNFKQGGIQRHIQDLSSHLREKGHHVTLAGAPNVWGNKESDPNFVELALDQVAATGRSRLGRVRAIFECATRLRSVLREREIDLVHCHETAPALVVRAALRNKATPKIITYHGSAPSRTRQFARVSRYCADHVVSPSQTTLNELISFGVPKEKTRVLGLGISEKPEPDISDVRRIRSALKLKDTDPLFVSLSRLDHQKGIDVMIDVAKRVLTEAPEAVFAICGTGPLDGQVQNWAQTAGLDNRFVFLGSVSNVQDYLAAADVFLLTSRWEALPISIVEAFRAGLPVIATDCGGVAELVDETVGRLCGVEDVDTLTKTVLELGRDPNLRKRLSEAALRKSQDDRFDPQTVHDAFEAFYFEVAGLN